MPRPYVKFSTRPKARPKGVIPAPPESHDTGVGLLLWAGLGLVILYAAFH